ncbi:VOC family protein [Methylobacterium nonmethylotrophicum]|uniref:VOC family protein n=1 Tax=Methylobacterium nonmethylotrophicum TaxID=1141884 RepID=A0A4Z0NKC7_9HYPH|nr:VOC family protein [Methylobacterium nonmethylotrophicum]TGD95948.1 VOC family protein [Methylobacterium nonmethylotrophicum]
MSVISHICLGTADLARAVAFYAPLLEELDLTLRFHEPENGWAGWMPRDADRPLLIVGRPWNGQAPDPGNGHMIALTARSRAGVDRCYALALAAGGTCEGPPGLRPHYHPAYYGAYVRDLDGNKLCVVCHEAEGDA